MREALPNSRDSAAHRVVLPACCRIHPSLVKRYTRWYVNNHQPTSAVPVHALTCSTMMESGKTINSLFDKMMISNSSKLDSSSGNCGANKVKKQTLNCYEILMPMPFKHDFSITTRSPKRTKQEESRDATTTSGIFGEGRGEERRGEERRRDIYIPSSVC